MAKKQLYLVFINALGQNYRGESIYEFIFSETVTIEPGEDWDREPASSGNPTPPPIEFINGVSILKTNEIQLNVIQKNDTFSLYDAVDTVIALGWETESPDLSDRLVFHFGDTFESVKEKLYERDININIE